jgi:uncharacterized protein YoxC
MNDIVQADIFFFVTTIAVLVIAIAIVVLIYFVVKAVQEIRKVVRTIEQEVDNLVIKRHNAEVYTLTIQKVLKALVKGELFRPSGRSKIEE